MRSSIFIYIVTNLVLFQILALESTGINIFVYGLCTLGILTFGLSHGAIDDVLYQKNENRDNASIFILKYLFAIFSYFVLWFLLPNLALVGFILLSGYHFGQAQFVGYNFENHIINKTLFISWGTMIILFLFYCNRDYLVSFGQSFPALPSSLLWMILNSGILFLAAIIVFISILMFKFLQHQINFESIVLEFFIMGLVAFSFSMLDPFISFSLFFVIIHSIEALDHELDYFKNKLGIKKLSRFIKILMPYTIFTLLGLGLVSILMFYFEQWNYIPFVILILISSLTTPHSYIMNEFYITSFNQNK